MNIIRNKFIKYLSFSVLYFIICFSFANLSLAANNCIKDKDGTVRLNGEIVSADKIGTCDNIAPYISDDCEKGVACYKLLEPVTVGEYQTDSIQIKDGSLTTYLQTIFDYALVTVTVIAIFMLMYGGIQYLTTDIASKKSGGKEIIVRAITGLIFVFSVWFILNLINPDLTKTLVDLGGNVGNTNSSIGNSNTATTGSNTTNTIITKITTCPEGVEDLGGNIKVCKKISEEIKKLLSEAKAAGINLTTSPNGSYRPPEEQIKLRKQNCGTTNYDIYEKPSGKCNPPTAIPGSSNHEKGLAIDFGLDGVAICSEVAKNITAQNDCAKNNKAWVWLKANAGKHGFSNNIDSTKEAWHWSVNGR